MKKKRLKEIIQYIVDCNGHGCIGDSFECEECPVDKYCGECDYKHMVEAKEYAKTHNIKLKDSPNE